MEAMKIISLFLAAVVLLTPAFSVMAASRVETTRQVPRASISAQVNERAVLRQEGHAERLARVQGVVRGMTNKLDNLFQRLNRQLENVEQRLAALETAGHELSVETELKTLRRTITDTQASIVEIKEALASLVDSASPRQQVATVREMIKGLRTHLEDIRTAFQALRLAVKDDVRTSPQPLVSPAL
jgi:DnaJ-domain-containing protein 1